MGGKLCIFQAAALVSFPKSSLWMHWGRWRREIRREMSVQACLLMWIRLNLFQNQTCPSSLMKPTILTNDICMTHHFWPLYIMPGRRKAVWVMVARPKEGRRRCLIPCLRDNIVVGRNSSDGRHVDIHPILFRVLVDSRSELLDRARTPIDQATCR